MRTIVLLAFLLFPHLSLAQEKKQIGKGNYLIFPCTTELQQRGRKGERWHHILINGSAAVRKNGTIDPAAIDFEKLRRELAETRQGLDKQNISVSITYHNPEPTEKGRWLLYLAVKGLTGIARFPKAQVGSDFGPYWGHALKAIKRCGPPNAKQTEKAIGGKLVKAYPIRTAYSSYTCSDADCFVDLVVPVSEDSDSLGDKEVKAIRTAVRQLKLPQRKHIMFCMTVNSRTPRKTSRKRLRALQKLGEQLGFENTTVRVEPNITD